MDFHDLDDILYAHFGSQTIRWSLSDDSNALSLMSPSGGRVLVATLDSSKVAAIRSVNEQASPVNVDIVIHGNPVHLYMIAKRAKATQWIGIASTDSNVQLIDDGRCKIDEMFPNTVVDMVPRLRRLA